MKLFIENRSLYNHTIFNSAYFHRVVGAGFRCGYRGQWHDTLLCGRIRFGHDLTLVHASSIALCKEQGRASVDCGTEGPEMTTWSWWFAIYWVQHVCLLWSFIVQITNYTSGCMKVTSITASLHRPGTNVCIWF